MQSWQRDCALEGSGLQLREAVFVSTHFSFLRMCGTSSNSRGFSGCTPPRLSWTGRPMLLALPPLAAVANNSGSSASSAVCSLSGGTPDCRVPVQWWRRALLARLTVLLAMPSPLQPAGRVSSLCGYLRGLMARKKSFRVLFRILITWIHAYIFISHQGNFLCI